MLCKSCGLIFDQDQAKTQKIPLPSGGYHLKASCPECGKYIKFLPHSRPKLYFGQYKDQYIDKVAETDPNYLRWVIKQDWCRKDLKKQIKTALKENV